MMMDLIKEMPEHIFWLAAIAIVTLAYGYMGDGDYVEAVRAQEFYCDNVASGAWPNYNEVDCNGL